MNATGSGAIAGKENASTFAGRNGDTAPPKVAQVPPERIPDLFRDKRVEEWRASRTGVPADMKAMTDREETVTEWIPTS